MRELKEKLEADFLSKKNVVGVALGQKWINGINTKEDAILVFVNKKINKNLLNKNDIIPNSVDGIKTDVVGKTGIIKPHSLTGKIRPVRPGYSCGHRLVTAGTIGGFFKDFEGKIVGLSNNHVIAATNLGRNVVDKIYQPGPYDASITNNEIGFLKRYRTLASRYQYSFNAADWSRIYGYNLEDSGIFQLNDQSNIDFSIPNIGFINDFNDSVSVGDDLQKTGRTTGYTTGRVIAVNATVVVGYDRGDYVFRDQIITNAMSEGGDSGSLTFDMNKNVVGLLFAGSQSVTIHNRIRYPRSTFGLTIYNPVRLTESLSYNITSNGNSVQHSFSQYNDFNSAVEHARNLAIQGNDVSLNVNFNSRPL